MQQTFTFPKREHLCGEIRIAQLFKEGSAFIAYPLRIVYRIVPGMEIIPVKVMVGVPKKRFKRAVKRNRLKRLMRESYRLNKYLLIDQMQDKQVHLEIAFNYVADQEVDFTTIESKMKIALHKIVNKLEELKSGT